MVEIAGDTVTQRDLNRALASGRSVLHPPGTGGGPFIVGDPSSFPTNLPAGTTISNAPPHPGLMGPRPTWFGTPVQRGKIVRYRDTENTSYGANDAVSGAVRNDPEIVYHFIFNPSSIGFSYSMNPNVTNQSGAADTTSGILGETMLSFSLLTDRHLDVLERTSSPKHIAAGVLADMFVLELLLGVKSATNPNNVGVASPMPVHVYFGTDSRSFQFRGTMESLSNEITHFSPEMIPVRMATQLSFRRQYDSTALMDSSSFDATVAAGVKARNQAAADAISWGNHGRVVL